MADLGEPYVGLEEMKAYLMFDEGITVRDEDILGAAVAASEKIEECCDRQFNRAEIASTRIYEPTLGGRLLVDDFWTTDGLLVSAVEGGASWTLDRLDLRPQNGILNGRPGWPYYEIRARDSIHSFPVYGPSTSSRYGVAVTAKWGWVQVPGPVRQATKILAGQLFKLSEAPLGVAGFNQFGAAIRVRDMPPQVKMLLAPYERNKLQVG